MHGQGGHTRGRRSPAPTANSTACLSARCIRWLAPASVRSARAPLLRVFLLRVCLQDSLAHQLPEGLLDAVSEGLFMAATKQRCIVSAPLRTCQPAAAESLGQRNAWVWVCQLACFAPLAPPLQSQQCHGKRGLPAGLSGLQVREIVEEARQVPKGAQGRLVQLPQQSGQACICSWWRRLGGRRVNRTEYLPGSPHAGPSHSG